MWVLDVSTTQSVAQTFYLTAGEWTIGRKSCDINLPFDASISRNHATLLVGQLSQSEIEDINSHPSLEFVDQKSRFGSFINDQKCNSKKPLKEGDHITFGAKKTIISVRSCAFNLVSSRLREEKRKKVEEACKKLGMHSLRSRSRDATHCITESGGIVATEKILWALVYNQFIVTPAWLDAVMNRSNLAVPLPKCEDFTPIDDQNAIAMSKYLPNPKRKHLFQNFMVTFLVPCSMEGMIREMGGVEIAAYEKSNAEYDEILVKKIKVESNSRNALIVSSSSSTHSMTSDAKEALKRRFHLLSTANMQFTTEQELAEKVIFTSPPSNGVGDKEFGGSPRELRIEQSSDPNSEPINDTASPKTQTGLEGKSLTDMAENSTLNAVKTLSGNGDLKDTSPAGAGEWTQKKRTSLAQKTSFDGIQQSQPNVTFNKLVREQRIALKPVGMNGVNYKRFKKGNSFDAHSKHSLFPVQTFVAISPHQTLQMQTEQHDLEALEQQERIADELFTMGEKRNARKRL